MRRLRAVSKEVAMKVFTSVFVVEGPRTSFEELETTLKSDRETEGPSKMGRKQMLEVHVSKETPPGRDGRRA